MLLDLPACLSVSSKISRGGAFVFMVGRPRGSPLTGNQSAQRSAIFSWLGTARREGGWRS